MSEWHQKFIDSVVQRGPGSYLVDFPAYRPDLVGVLAQKAGCMLLDFRARDLAPLGFEAHKLPLGALDAAAEMPESETGIVIQNAEALLATKPATERRAWLAAFLAIPRKTLAVIPLALFGREVADHPRVIRFEPGELPADSFLSQLATLRLSS
ncbi:MAG: hypothetical protein LCH39_06910 [Proteobacteria bacterium]|nr:hypothetical protein [Pseudomonadota bacterium]